jgi:hypothetical protein
MLECRLILWLPETSNENEIGYSGWLWLKKSSRVEVAKLRSRIGMEEKNYKKLIYLDLFLVSIVNARGMIKGMRAINVA